MNIRCAGAELAAAEKGSGWELHTQHMLLTADDTSSLLHPCCCAREDRWMNS